MRKNKLQGWSTDLKNVRRGHLSVYLFHTYSRKSSEFALHVRQGSSDMPTPGRLSLTTGLCVAGRLLKGTALCRLCVVHALHLGWKSVREKEMKGRGRDNHPIWKENTTVLGTDLGRP